MRTWVLVTVATLLGVAFVVVIRIPAMSDTAVLVLSNAGQLLAAALASAGCEVASRRTTDHRRRAWPWLSIGTGAWAEGGHTGSSRSSGVGQTVSNEAIGVRDAKTPSAFA